MRLTESAAQIEPDRPDRPYFAATSRNRRATIAVRGCGVLTPPEHEKLIRVDPGCLPTRPQRGQTGNSTSIGAVIVRQSAWMERTRSSPKVPQQAE
jgi:hypothetical protein